MATQKYEKLIKDICKMDKPTANPQSGLMRWQTKRVNNSAISESFHDSSVANRSQINTPGMLYTNGYHLDLIINYTYQLYKYHISYTEINHMTLCTVII